MTNQTNNQSIIPSTDVIQLILTLKMTTTQVVVACTQMITKLWLVPSAKQRRDPCSGPPTDSTNYRKCVSNFLSTWVAITTNKTKAFFNWPIVARTQIWVHSWKSRTRISVLFCRRSYPEFNFVCAQSKVVETSVTVNNNRPIQDYIHSDDQTQPTFEIEPLRTFQRDHWSAIPSTQVYTTRQNLHWPCFVSYSRKEQAPRKVFHGRIFPHQTEKY